MAQARPETAPNTGSATDPGDGRVLDAVILGAGFAGLGMAIKLQQAGRDDFVILEKASEIGGTWRDNRYPGCACDVPSHLYSFSFEPYAGWSRLFPTQSEILDYLLRVADRHRLRPKIRFGAEAVEARFDEARNLWHVRTAGGRSFVSRYLVSAMGGLSRPALPDIPGRERFAGPAFHSAQWRHDVDLAGRRVAVIGTGASAIQFVPRIAPQAGRLSLFQRTPPWILPKLDRAHSSLEKRLIERLPGYRRLLRALIYWTYELRALAFQKPALMRRFQRMAREHLASQVADPALRARLLPDYTMGCKRVLIANDYYPALQRPNVELVTERVAEIVENGVVTADGRLHEADVLIFGTGFRATDLLSPMRILGRAGLDLDQAWREGASAHFGTTVAGFPNLFLLVGPNTGLGHNSIVFMIEAQLRYVMDCLKQAAHRGAAAIEPLGAAQAAYNADIQQRLGGTVWASGCRSWYLDAAGRNTTLWPGFTVEFWWRTRRARAADYAFVPPGKAADANP